MEHDTARTPPAETRRARSAAHAAGSRERVAEPRGDWAMTGLTVLMVGLILLRSRITTLIEDQEALAAWLTIFVSIGLESLPFLVLGVVLSAAVSVLVPADALQRRWPRRPGVAVPAAALSGLVLPVGEGASVPVGGALVSRGVRPAVAVTFLLAAPAVNPVVLVSTAVAFSGHLEMVGARFVASLLTAVVVGWTWLLLGRGPVTKVHFGRPSGGSRVGAFVAAARLDLLRAGGFLVLGAAVVATVNVLVPATVLDTLAADLFLSVALLAAFAVVIAVCSETDAFVVASLSQLPPTAQLAFMVVGPVVDVRLVARQAATFGRGFAALLSPLTFVVALGCALGVGMAVL
jgi:uncharacterized membrane protein YraQ (UPF0718 family)